MDNRKTNCLHAITAKHLVFFLSVRIGSIPELPAETCHEIKSSEGQAASGKYWFCIIKTGTSILAYCDMETEGDLSYTKESIMSTKILALSIECQAWLSPDL